MKGIWRKTIGGLKPADPIAEEAYQAIPLGGEVFAEPKRARSVQHHRWFFALLKIIFDNQEHYKSLDELLIAVKIAAGHYYPVVMKNGQTALVPKSIAFSKMDEIEFKAFADKVVSIVITKFLPNVDREELEAEIMSMVS